jgi:hypothetical protein
MSRFCGGTGSIPSMTNSELRAPFPSGLLPAGLPELTDGMASEDWVTNYVKELASQGRIPLPSRASEVQSTPFDSPDASDPIARYVKDDNALLDNIKSEYCFYESRYFSSLNSFLTAIADASLRGQNQEVIDSRLSMTRRLNGQLTVLTQIVNAISKFRYSTSTQYQNDINSLNDALRKRKVKLVAQNKILVKETAAADLNKQMVQYTIEKNKANSHLLTFYGILNITALAIVFYISRS